MSFTRFYSWSCDMPGCHKTVVQEYVDGEIIPESNFPGGWIRVYAESLAPRYICRQCTGKYGGIFLEKLYPPSYVQSSDPGAQGGDKTAHALIINPYSNLNLYKPSSVPP